MYVHICALLSVYMNASIHVLLIFVLVVSHPTCTKPQLVSYDNEKVGEVAVNLIKFPSLYMV